MFQQESFFKLYWFHLRYPEGVANGHMLKGVINIQFLSFEVVVNNSLVYIHKFHCGCVCAFFIFVHNLNLHFEKCIRA